MTENHSLAMALVYCPCPSLDEAKRLSGASLDAKLAGCINIIPAILSLYDWRGTREETAEAVLIAKSTVTATPRLREFLQREHPCEVPAILTLELADVNAPYRESLMQGIA